MCVTLHNTVHSRKPRFGEIIPKIGMVGRILGRRFRRVKVPGTFQQIPQDIFVNYIYKNFTRNDLFTVQRLCKAQNKWVKIYIISIYRKLVSCAPIGLIYKLEYNRWMTLFQDPAHQLTNPLANPVHLTFEMMGNSAFKFWKRDDQSFFALRYMSQTAERMSHGLVVFYQSKALNWWVVSPWDRDSARLCGYFRASHRWDDRGVDCFTPDDWVWDYFGNLIQGKVCDTGSNREVKITLWNEKQWNNTQ